LDFNPNKACAGNTIDLNSTRVYNQNVYIIDFDFVY
jgi:hypothetical protein